MKIKFILSTLFLLPFFSISGQHLSKEKLKQLNAITTKDVPDNAPGVATGIVKNGKVIYSKVTGCADLKSKQLIGEQSRFNIASNGKQFTAFAILCLIENKQLQLKDDIRTFFPNLYPNIKKEITVEHLLTHSSGIRDVYDLWALQGITWWKQRLSNKDAFELLQQQQELNFEVGTSYSYSNSNYILLALIVQKISGLSFVEYTNELFQKLNMPNTFFVANSKKLKGPIAKPYFNFNTWVGYNWTCDINGDGNLFSTLEDQLQWEKIVQTKRNDFFSKNLLEKSQNLIANSHTKKYGYGLEFGQYKKQNYKFHLGATGAWQATTVRFPKDTLSIVTLSNSGKISSYQQTLQMVDVLLEQSITKETFITAPPKIGTFLSIKEILGFYQSPNGYIMEFIERDGDLYLLRTGKNDIKLIRNADNIFQQWNDTPFKQEFTRNKAGIMQVTAYYNTVPPFTLTRIESDLSNFSRTTLNGRFKNKETGVAFDLQYIGDKKYELRSKKQKLMAVLLNENELLVEDYRIRFSSPTKGTVQEFFVNSGRIQNVRFERVAQ